MYSTSTNLLGFHEYHKHAVVRTLLLEAAFSEFLSLQLILAQVHRVRYKLVAASHTSSLPFSSKFHSRSSAKSSHRLLFSTLARESFSPFSTARLSSLRTEPKVFVFLSQNDLLFR